MKATLLGLVCLAAWLLVSVPATAGGPHHRSYHHGHGGGGWRASFFVGGAYPAYQPYWRPAYYPPPGYYYYPAPAYPVYPAPVVVAPAPVVAPSLSVSFGGR